MTSEVVKIKSERNKDLIIIRNSKFSFHKNLKFEKKRWCCVVKTCKSYIKTDISETQILEENVVCTHAVHSDSEICRQKIRNSAKRKAEKDACDRPLKLMRDEINIHDCCDVADFFGLGNQDPGGNQAMIW